MFGRSPKIILLSSILVFVGCARPKYIAGNEPNSPQGTQENKLSCTVQFKSSRHCLTWSWVDYPTVSQSGSLLFKIYRLNLADQTPVELDTNLNPELVLWMPSMGHGSVPTRTERVDVGTYKVSNVFFIMPGEWELKFQLAEGNEIRDEAVVALTF